jgi:hypothetical protein
MADLADKYSGKTASKPAFSAETSRFVAMEAIK